MISFSLEKKVALITGASRGIGEAIALGLSDYGASCILVGRKIEALEVVKQKIEDKGGKAKAYACHMGEMDQIKALFEKIRAEDGKLDILVNNAATNPYFGGLLEAPEWAMDKTFEVNLKGPFFHESVCGAAHDGKWRRVDRERGLDQWRSPCAVSGDLFHYQGGDDFNDKGFCKGACREEYPGQRPFAGAHGNQVFSGHN
jgi:hypothetical protein